MIKAKHHPVIYPFFQYYLQRMIKKRFSSVSMIGEYQDDGLPVLVLSNHISWWDGFWVGYLKIKCIHRKFHFMMLEDQLKKYWFFNHCGGFSINPGARDILESVQYASDLLKDKNNMVLLFPQGELHSLYDNKIVFMKGLKKILQKTDNPFKIIFVANMPEYFSSAKPELFIHHKTYTGLYDFDIVAQEYQDFYNDVISFHKAIDKR